MSNEEKSQIQIMHEKNYKMREMIDKWRVRIKVRDKNLMKNQYFLSSITFFSVNIIQLLHKILCSNIHI